MKILFITSIYLPHIGGIELYVNHLASELAKSGNEVCIFVGDRFSGRFSDSVEYGIRTIRVPVLYIKGMTYLKNARAKKILEKELAGADVVHLNDVKFLYKTLALKRAEYGYKLFLSSHGFIFHTKSFLFLKNLFMKKMSKYSKFYDLNYCVSENDLQIAHKFHFMNLKMLIPGTDVHKFEKVNPDVFENSSFLCWGRIAENKGTLRLVEIFQSLKENFTLKIIGSCDNDEYLQKVKAAAKNDRRIEFLGYKSDEEILEFVQNAEFLVFPSLHEGFGMSLVEGLSSGKKIVANKIETFCQILEECNAAEFLFDFTAPPEKLLEKINELRTVFPKKMNLEKYSVEYMSKIIEGDYKKQ